jgi:hypothetical protein
MAAPRNAYCYSLKFIFEDVCPELFKFTAYVFSERVVSKYTIGFTVKPLNFTFA